MASATSTTISPYSDYCQRLQQSTIKHQNGYIRVSMLSSPAVSHLSIHRTIHSGCQAASYPKVVCSYNPKATAVTRHTWDKLVLKNSSPVLVEFYASWCGPCQMVHRVIDEIATEYGGKLDCFVLDADKNSTVTEEYDVKAVPVVMLFKNGRKYDCVVGTMPKEFYVDAIEKLLRS